MKKKKRKSPPGAVSEREGAEERQRGWEEAPCEDQEEEEEERGGFSPFQLRQPSPARRGPATGASSSRRKRLRILHSHFLIIAV